MGLHPVLVVPWRPPVCLQIDMSLVGKGDAFTTQALFHDVRPFEVPLARQRAEPVDDAVARQAAPHGGVQGPPYGARRPSATDVLSNVAIRRHPTRRYLRDDVPHAFEEVLAIIGHEASSGP